MTDDQPCDTPNRKRSISLKIAVLTRQLNKRFDQRVASIGITRSQWTVVAVVSRRPGVTQREVSQALEMSEAAAGRLIERLCAEGLLARAPKHDDRRAHCIHLTEKSQVILSRISAIAAENEATIFAGFAPDDLGRFEAYLDLIAANSAAG